VHTCLSYDASYNSLVNGVPSNGPSLGGPQYDANGHYLFTACSPPTGAMNVSSNCGYQPGQGMKDGFQQYQKMVSQEQCCTLYALGGAVLADCSNISPVLSNYIQKNEAGRFLYGSWARCLGGMGMSDFFAFPQAQILTAQYVQSLSWGATTQSAVQRSCKSASQAVTTFVATHPAAPIPPALLQAAGNCAQAVMPVH
jgi:hypothetical protein